MFVLFFFFPRVTTLTEVTGCSDKALFPWLLHSPPRLTLSYRIYITIKWSLHAVSIFLVSQGRITLEYLPFHNMLLENKLPSKLTPYIFFVCFFLVCSWLNTGWIYELHKNTRLSSIYLMIQRMLAHPVKIIYLEHVGCVFPSRGSLS